MKSNRRVTTKLTKSTLKLTKSTVKLTKSTGIFFGSVAGFRLFEPPTAPSRLELESAASGPGFETVSVIISGGFIVVGDVAGDVAVFGDVTELCRSGVLGFDEEGGPIVSTGVISIGSSSGVMS